MITRVFLLTGFCLIFICSQIVNASLQGKWFFDCKNGQKIPAEMKCDAHTDCTDGSDETFVECHKVVCPELACSYGGCYKESQQCDGNEDCWDHTDEHPEYCSPNTTNMPDKDIGSCGKNQFKCVTSSECLPIERVCDGIKDCQDGTDETHKNCLISKCTNETFRCAYGGCLARSKVCDNEIHCWDESDELPPICSENGTTTGATYDDPQIRKARETQKDMAGILGSCKVPENLQNLQIRTLFNILPYHKALPVESSKVVRLSCLNNTELTGPDLNQCLDGKWQNSWPKCREACRRKFIRDTSIQALCQNKKNGPTTNCNQKDSKLFVGTNAYISCASGYVPKGSVKPPMTLKCTKSLKENRPYWSAVAKTNQLQCVPECGKIYSDEYPQPWVVSLFTSDIYHRKFRFQGYGYIISPWTVVVSLRNITTDDVLRHAVAEGGHQVEYTENDTIRAYQLHSVRNIFKSKKLAVLELVNPFILSASVRPICLPPIPKIAAYKNFDSIVTIRQNGQEISYLKNMQLDILKHKDLVIQREKSMPSMQKRT